jgi:hypothetical protein
VPQFLEKARQVFNLPDEDIIEGQEQVRSQKPTASDDEILKSMIEYAKNIQPEVLKQAMAPVPSEQEVQSLYDIAEERARKRRLKAMPGDILSGVGEIFVGRPEMAGEPIRAREVLTRREELGRVRERLGREEARRKGALEKFRAAAGIEEMGRAREKEKKAIDLASREADPNSAESKQFQALVEQTIGKKLNAPASELRQMFPQLVKIYTKQLDIAQKQIESQIKQAEKIRGKEEKASKEQRSRQKDVLAQIDKFKSDTKDIRKQFEQIANIQSLLKQGKFNSAFEVSKTMMVRMAGDPRPSDADLARISPNPSFIQAAQRFMQRKAMNRPNPDDVKELELVVGGLAGGIKQNLRGKAIDFAKARGKFLPGITPEALEDTILTEIGMKETEISPIKRKSIKELSDEELDRELEELRKKHGG